MLKHMQDFKKSKIFESREFITLSILSCITHTFSVSNDKLYVQEGFDSGSELEVFSMIEVLPRENLWMLNNKYELVDVKYSKIHDIKVENSIKAYKFGPSLLKTTSKILNNDANYFDIGKFYYKDEGCHNSSS